MAQQQQQQQGILDEEAQRLMENDIEEEIWQSNATTAERILYDMQIEQQRALITDLFALMSRVLRNRVGKIQQLSDTAWDDIMRLKEMQIFAFSMAGVACNISIASIFWYSGVVIDDVRKDEVLDIDNLNRDVNTVRGAILVMLQIIMSLTTLVTCILICQKYALVVQEKRRQWSGVETYDLVQAKDNEEVNYKFQSAYSFWRSNFRYSLLVELVVHFAHPLIWMYTEGSGRDAYELLSVLMFLRLYLTVNLVYIFSQEYRARHEVIASNPELQRTGFRITVSATLRMLFFKYPAKVTMILLAASLLSLGFIIFVVERNNQPDISAFGSFDNCFWFTFITFTTVGYGDMAPTSTFGRLVAVCIGAIGITITTVFGGVVTNLMGQSREQRSVSEYLASVSARDQCKHSAALVIQAAWRYYKRKVGDIVMMNAKTGHKSNVVYATIKMLKSHRWNVSQARSTANDPVIDWTMNSITRDLKDCVEDLEKHEKSVTATMCTLESFVLDIGKVLDNRALRSAE